MAEDKMASEKTSSGVQPAHKQMAQGTDAIAAQRKVAGGKE